ncbi:MAG: hypothetical protein IKE75_03585 [Bacilli bacterium]|nr:hypothetical protein [Bacilli bacterium]
MKKSKPFAFFKSHWQLLFCFSLIVVAFILFLIIFIKKPRKSFTEPLYKNNDLVENVNLTSIKQHIYPKKNNISAFRVELDKISEKSCNLNIKISDEKGNTYFDQYVENYSDNSLYLYIGELKDAVSKRFELTVDIDSCSSIKVPLVQKYNKDTYLENYSKKSLKISIDTSKVNTSYGWYPLMILSIALLLFPLARRKK